MIGMIVAANASEYERYVARHGLDRNKWNYVRSGSGKRIDAPVVLVMWHVPHPHSFGKGSQVFFVDEDSFPEGLAR